ncbi:extended synaptotagmin-like protein 2a isoform X2 [Tribolium castaneum]|uniref:Extended synaptotagmin-2-like Protein n=1 Tax=Tribolium castaneum TaxID=7070 RepID=D6WLV7_TRICA|nr:extended synaptotagmin-like protein 2a [Tribolium castaneum]EFA04170.2 Extended synaptotagmin-2-like Protein [Tribolium castaneum]|eukprot:NP_001165864.1 extended synaptotagmin-like protein 2a [Tribolium castaneum]
MSVSKDGSQAMEKRSEGSSILSVIFSAVKKASIVGIVYFAGYMQWSVAWFIGPIVLFVIRDQWKKASDRKRNIAKAAALASEKDVVLARLDDLPAWVFFPDVERAEWLNRIIKQVWPNINHYTRDLIRDTIQPILKESLETYKLSGFKFERIILGTVPFRIGGVKVYDKNVARNEIIMDLDIFYAGDCDITFYLAGIKGGIRDFQLHGMLRVVMKPLITTIPLVGGLQVFFLNNPDIDFDLIGIADLLDMPGLSDILRRIVVETVASMMVLPNKFPIKLSDDVDAMELKAPEPEGVLRVHVVEAKHLMKKDIGVLGKGKSDPYAVVTLGAQEFKTKVIDNSVDPKWDFWCEFNVLESDGQQLYIHLWDKDETSDDETLGRATIEVSNIVKKGQDDLWVTLEQAKHGMVHLRLTWLTLSDNYSDLKAALEETQQLRVTSMSTALLTIFLDSAKNLPQARASTKPDPYAVLKVGNTTKETKVLERTIHPVWEQGFSFLVANPESDTLYLTIIDRKTTNELGQVTYNISKLAKKTKMEVYKEPFSLLKSGPESKVIWSMHLRVLKRAEGVDDTDSGDLPSLQREDSKVLTSDDVPPTPNPTPEINESATEPIPNYDEMIKATAATVASTPIKESELTHRSPSVTSSAGAHDLGRIQLTIRYSVQRQRLIVVVHQIANIPLKDPSNIPDPYVKLYLLPERAKDTKRKTHVVKDNCNPIFDESFEYILSQGELNTKQLEVTVASQKQLFYSSSNILGMVIIDFEKLNVSQPYNAWFDLTPESDRNHR